MRPKFDDQSGTEDQIWRSKLPRTKGNTFDGQRLSLSINSGVPVPFPHNII